MIFHVFINVCLNFRSISSGDPLSTEWVWKEHVRYKQNEFHFGDWCLTLKWLERRSAPWEKIQVAD